MHNLVKELDEAAAKALACAPKHIPNHLLSIAARRIEELERQLAAQSEQRSCNACTWKGPLADTIMLGAVGPLCPDCHETTEVDAPAAQQPAQSDDARMLDWLEMMGNKPEGLLLHDGGDFTGRTGLGLRRVGRSLRQAVRKAMQRESGK